MLAGYPATMSYATIMVQVDADGEADGRIHVAAQLADRFQSRLIGISSWTPRPPLAVEAVVVDAETPEGVASRNAALKARGERFKRVAGLVDRRMEWRCDQEFPTPYVIREARAADLLVIGRERKNLDPYLFVDPASLLLGVGRPVLLVPPDVNSIDITKVVVAWKDTREAQRAVRDALPLLQQAEMIVLTGIYESPGGLADAEEGLDDVEKYLAAHGIEAVIRRLQPLEDSVEDSLLRVVHSESSDLIVAGAYGHSRVGEWIFGGVTQALLARSPVCCLLSH
jgi:nucleotide-binding universal stress UspA family protein